jgi:hypothetical protein
MIDIDTETDIIPIFQRQIKWEIHIIAVETWKRLLIKRILSPHLLSHEHRKSVDCHNLDKRSVCIIVRTRHFSTLQYIDIHPFQTHAPSSGHIEHQFWSGKSDSAAIRLVKFTADVLKPVFRNEPRILMHEKKVRKTGTRATFIIYICQRTRILYILNSDYLIGNISDGFGDIPSEPLQSFRINRAYDNW